MDRKIERFEPYKDCAADNRLIWKYNSNNRIIEESSYYFNKISSTDIYSYTDSSYTIMYLDYNDNGEVQTNTDKDRKKSAIYKLDAKRNIIEVIGYNINSQVLFKTLNKYNSHNKLIESIDLDQNENIIWKEVYEYK